MARGGLEAAFWDLEARRNGVPLWQADWRRSQRDLLRRFHRHSGFHRRAAADHRRRAEGRLSAHQDEDQARPGHRHGPRGAQALPCPAADGGRQLGVHAGRRGSPAAVSTNSYLMMIEQPLGARRNHRPRQAAVAAPDAHLPGRVHPLGASCRTGHPSGRLAHHQHQAGPRGRIRRGAQRTRCGAARAGIPVWCGGMLESGIGRAHNIALSTLPNFTLPGDVSASSRYWQRDIIPPEVEVSGARHNRRARRARLRLRIDVDLSDSITVRRETLGAGRGRVR